MSVCHKLIVNDLERIEMSLTEMSYIEMFRCD